MLGSVISPEILDVMAQIEQLEASVAKGGNRTGSSSEYQRLIAATFWGAPKLVAALRAIQAISAAHN